MSLQPLEGALERRIGLRLDRAMRARLDRYAKEAARSNGLSLDDSLQFMKGIGPQAAAALERLNLRTVGDLLRHIPRRWEDRTRFLRVAEVRGGEWVTVCGLVIAATTKYPKGPKLALTGTGLPFA